jgi:hypothetical protein
MPTLKLEYKILLSSPSDLDDERQAASEIVTELNSSWGSPNGAVIKMLSWESDVAPSFGSEPQDVINRQMGDNWDVYLGIMHARFGTPTKQYGSGTEEEFERAYQLWKANEGNRVLMFYFKNAPVDLDQIDLEQASKVRAFKQKMSGLGGLYRQFSDIEKFKDLWRAHLTAVLVDLHKRQAGEANISRIYPVGAAKETEPHPPEIPLGILDFAEASFTGLIDIKRTIDDMGELMVKSTNHIEAESIVLGQVTTLGDLAGMRRSITSFAKNMTELASDLAAKRQEYGLVSRRCFDAMSKGISIAKTANQTGQNNMEEFAGNITVVIDAIDQFVLSFRVAENALDTIPNIARDFNAARQLLKREFNNLRVELNASTGLLKDLRAIAQG